MLIADSLLQWSFERLYHEFAWAYDAVALIVSRGYWPAWTRTALPHLDGARVLELGCGTGHLQLALAQARIDHVGYDLSPTILRVARGRLQRAELLPRLLRGRAQALPFRSGRFSDVVATFPAPYIVDPATLNEVARVLQPGGQLLIIDGGASTKRDLLDRAIDAAYRVSQEHSPASRYDQPLVAAGFAVTWQAITVGHSTVLVGAARHP